MAGRHSTGAMGENSHWSHMHEAMRQLTGPPVRPYLPLPTKQFYHLGTKSSNIWAHGSHCHANYHSYRCLKSTPSDVLLLERLYLNRFHDFLKQHHQLRTKCSNIGSYGGHFSFKPTRHLSLWHRLHFLYRYCASEQANKQTKTNKANADQMSRCWFPQCKYSPHGLF